MNKYKWESWKKEYNANVIKNNLRNFLGLSESECRWYLSEDTEGDLENLLKQKQQEGYFCIVCDNRYALSMLSGARSNPCEAYFAGMNSELEQYGKRYSHKELEKLLKKNNISDYRFFYPYPNYHLPLAFYSDRYLPHKGELTNNQRNFGVDRWVLFDETAAWDRIIDDEMFAQFANSFLLVIGDVSKFEQLLFTKFSNDRNLKLNVRTDIMEIDCKKVVRKSAVSDESKRHVQRMLENGAKLNTAFEGTGYKFLTLRKIDEYTVEYDFLSGETLEDVLAKKAHADGVDSIRGDITEFASALRRAYTATSLCNLDFIFQNVIIENGEKVVIDYEWVFDTEGASENWITQLTPDFVIWRTLYYFAINENLSTNEKTALYNMADLELDRLDEYKQIEDAFQKYVSGEHTSLNELYLKYHGENVDFAKQVKIEEENRNYTVTDDKGNDIEFTQCIGGESATLNIKVLSGTNKVCINLGEGSYIAKVLSASMKDRRNVKLSSSHNVDFGELLLFDSGNSVINFDFKSSDKDSTLEVELIKHFSGYHSSALFSELVYNLGEQKKKRGLFHR